MVSFKLKVLIAESPDQETLKNYIDLRETGPVFTFDRHRAWQLCKDVGDRVDAFPDSEKNLHAHMLRHMHAPDLLLEYNFNIRVIQKDLLGFSITWIIWFLILAVNSDIYSASVPEICGITGAAAGTWFGFSRGFGGKRKKTEEEKKKARETFKKFTMWLFGGLFVFIMLLVIWALVG